MSFAKIDSFYLYALWGAVHFFAARREVVH